ncbi:MAG TPA: hypothetical protein VGA69_00695 [Nitriliruptorales bacterium]
MSTPPLRLLVAVLVLFLLGRAAIVAWQQRALAFEVWRRTRWRHLAGAAGLLIGVSTIAILLIEWVPPMRWGLGNLVGFTGNAVFVPLEEAAAAAGPPPASGPDWVLIGLTTLFLGPLVLLLPWLAFVEEEVFRAGLEATTPLQEGWWALRFGLAHLVMLVPLGATLAIGAAGLVYGRVYRHAHARWSGEPLPAPVRRAFRPTRRSARAADLARRPVPAVAGWGEPLLDRDPERRQAYGVLASTVWHATFNSFVVVTVWLAIVIAAW